MTVNKSAELLYQERCCRQCEAIKAYARFLNICDEWAAKRWDVYGHARRWAKNN